jgi:hypothetical protein
MVSMWSADGSHAHESDNTYGVGIMYGAEKTVLCCSMQAYRASGQLTEIQSQL